MKTTLKRTSAAVIVLLTLCTLGIALRAQTDNQSDADNPLQPVAPGDIPETGAFFRLSDYLTYSGSLGPPWPFLMTNAPVYSLDGSSFLVDDAVITNDVDLANALSLLVQPQDQFSRRLMTANSIDPSDGSGTNSSGGFTNNAQYSSIVDTNGLWLEVPTNSLATAGQMSVVLHNTIEDELYDILTTTNLSLPLTNWTVEQSVLGSSGDFTPLQLALNGRQNLFVYARFGGSSDGSGLPDWWELQYFGTNGIDPFAQDPSGDSWTYLDDFQKGFVPGTWHTPPPPQNFSVHVDSTRTNIVLNWQSGGGPVDHYEIEQGDDNDLFSVGTADNSTFNFIDNYWFDLSTAEPRRVVAVFPNGDRSPTAWAWPVLDLATIVFRGTGGQYFLALPNVPQNLAGVNFILSTYPSLTTEFVDATNVINGIVQIPQDLQLDIAQGGGFYVQLVDSNTNSGDYIYPSLAMYPEHQPGIATAITNFANASAQMKENLRFLIRSAGVLWPFGYSSGIRFDGQDIIHDIPRSGDLQHPEIALARPPVATNYEYYGFHTFSPNLNFSFIDELRPVRENYLWRNFVYDSADFASGTSDTGIDYSMQPSRGLYQPKYEYTGSGMETSLPLAFNVSTSEWLWFPDDNREDMGISQTESSFVLNNNVTNIWGLRLQSAHDSTNVISLGSSFYEYVNYGKFSAPDLQKVDYFFGSQTPFFNYAAGYTNEFLNSPTPYTNSNPVIPGSPSFSTTTTSPVLITGIGQPMIVSGWAKMAIVNGNPNTFAYLEQYFDFGQAYTVGNNGLATTNSAGLLSPYGDFFPTVPGPAALVTMPDIDTGERGTGVVNVIKLQLDVNHDGTMDLSFGGPDNTSQAHPFVFWINNDNDGNGIGTDIDPKGKTNLMDYTHCKINSQRNLEDLARLWIRGMPALPPAQGYAVTLSMDQSPQSDGGGSPAINLYHAYDFDGGIGYLTDTNISFAQLESFSVSGLFVDYNSAITMINTNQSYILPLSADGKLTFTNFLFEGSGIGEGRLLLTVWQGTNIIAQTATWLDLHDVKDFYERAVITNDTSGPPSNWTSAIETNLPASASGLGDDTNLIIMVHGINVSYPDWNIDSDTVFKRLYWSGFYGKFATVKWPCEFFRLWTLLSLDTSVFNRSEMKAYAASTSMKTYLDQLHERFPGYRVNLFVHSQGNAVVSEAIKEGGTFDTYILTEGALPASAYDIAAPLDHGLTNIQNTVPTPEWQPMGYHGIYTNISGRLVNFYNTNDPVTGVWIDDQTEGKPDGYTIYTAWNAVHSIIPPPPSSWYQYDSSTSNSLYETFSGFGSYVVTNAQQSRAYVSRSLTQPIGRNPSETGHGVIASGVDLTAHYGFGNAFPDDHSAQWVRPIQTTRPYYQQLLTSCQIVPAP